MNSQFKPTQCFANSYKAPHPQTRISYIPVTGSTTNPYMDKTHSILSNEFHILCCRI